ncbi:MAG: DUF4274 domain-containing protein [Lachnospiraceae bacterium]|nr:DUF4274 domain-containing protein [Lachnospiraceae bacterium]
MDLFEKIQDILYNDSSIEEIKKKIEELNNPQDIYVLSYNYNWDDGFEIPTLIINNSHCDLSTALLLFYSAEGEEYWSDDFDKTDEEQYSFINKLHDDILKGKFVIGGIEFIVPLSKVEKYKLRKKLNDDEVIFITDITGKDLRIDL